ncbi:MAG: c-type cytochrome [Lentisphaeria bacterium]|nr:c-type cytochrome [Candidatus Neomarinimicrobiota bacterium]MCF7842755.1 c-type cytochrome [Lentisphaeria bacterium]
MQAADPNYEPPPEMAGADGFQWSYRAPYYGEEDMTPLKRKELEKQIKAEAARMVAAQQAAGAIDATATSAMGFDELILLAMDKADEENLEKLASAFPELYTRFEAGETGSGADKAEPEEPELEALTDDASLAAGKEIYDLNCVPCHGKFGEGGIGPNLTDDYWINGGRYADIIHIINVGVPAKGMIAWDRTLKPQQIQEVASYIETLRGTDPPNPKAPQGDLFQQDEGE